MTHWQPNLKSARKMSTLEADVIVARAKKLRNETGRPWGTVAKQLGVPYQWLRRRCETKYRQHINTTARRYGSKYYRHRIESQRIYPIKLPPDTRDLTGRLMGDPRAGRSALDRRGAA